jgi:hypothetical protein
MTKIKLFEEYEMTPGDIERQNVINRRLNDITIKKEIENEIEFLKLIKPWIKSSNIPASREPNVEERIKILKSLLETL